MENIINYAFKQALIEFEIDIIKQCIDAKIVITNEILISCVTEQYIDRESEMDNLYYKKIAIFNDTFGKKNKDYPAKYSENYIQPKKILVRKIFNLLLENISDDLILSVDLINLSRRDDYLLNKIVKMGRYDRNKKVDKLLLYATLNGNDLSNAKLLLDTGYDIYLESIILLAIDISRPIILENLIKLNIDFHQFRPTILNSWEYGSIDDYGIQQTMMRPEIKQTLIDTFTILSKDDLLRYMLILCPEINVDLINNFDICNSIILILIQLIQKSNNEYITFLENTRPADYFQPW